MNRTLSTFALMLVVGPFSFAVAQDVEIVSWEVQTEHRVVPDGMTLYNVETRHYNPVVFPPGTVGFTGFMQGILCGLTDNRDHSGLGFCPWRAPMGVLDNQPDFSKYFRYGGRRFYLRELYQTEGDSDDPGHLILNIPLAFGDGDETGQAVRQYLWAVGTLHIGDRSFPLRNATTTNGVGGAPYEPPPHCNNERDPGALHVCWRNQEELFAQGETVTVRITAPAYGSVTDPLPPLDFRTIYGLDWMQPNSIMLLWHRPKSEPLCAGCSTTIVYRIIRDGETTGWINIPYTSVMTNEWNNYTTFTLTNMNPNIKYSFCIRDWKRSIQRGSAEVCNGEQFYPVNVEDAELPTETTLSQNYPNPFNPSTTVTYTLDRSGPVELSVYNLAGRVVSTLVDGIRPAGNHEVRFNANNLPTGMYLYRLRTDTATLTRTMTLVR
ncbi:MAG: T9SS type A sorting domain-containing protein [Bacteroidetes bacterium SB0662_bin_6]|nr:T9SS type A sorting domain-containing protein [Bacteroidetes bacterium SB0668_bin_1]MYE03494.1 T9SS type A sorting domain-containing protein [Bacteroidetes bacterium SB0662_bin_6]